MPADGAMMNAVAVIGLLVLYTILVLFARRAALWLWRRLRGPDTGTPVIKVPRLRDLGWGVALLPVTIGYLAVFGAFTLYTQSGSG